MDPITLALGLAQLAPAILPLFTEDKTAGVAASAVAAAAHAVTGKDLTNPAETGAVRDALNDPTARAEFQRIVNEHAVALLQAENQRIAAVLADVQSARVRETELAKAGHTSWEMILLSVLSIVGLLVITIVLFTHDPPAGAKETLIMIVGALISRVGDVYGFYFGSSMDAKKKG